jgi:hypothetical protein
MKEINAMQKWCPMWRKSRYVNANGETWMTTNRESFEDGITVDELGKCIGSQCMSWGWGVKENGLGDCRFFSNRL